MRTLADVVPMRTKHAEVEGPSPRLIVLAVAAALIYIVGYPWPASLLFAVLVLYGAGGLALTAYTEWREALGEFTAATGRLLVAIGAVWVAFMLLVSIVTMR